jgi:hypothetical protein
MYVSCCTRLAPNSGRSPVHGAQDCISKPFQWCLRAVMRACAGSATNGACPGKQGELLHCSNTILLPLYHWLISHSC